MAEGKKDLLLLDFSGNVMRLGHPNNPTITVPQEGKRVGKEVPDNPKDGETVKRCKKCKAILEAYYEVCPSCGLRLIREKSTQVQARNINVPEVPAPGRPKQDTTLSNIRYTFHPYISRAGNKMLRLVATGRVDGKRAPMAVSTYLDFAGNSGARMKQRAFAWWVRFSVNGNGIPKNEHEAIQRRSELILPTTHEVVFKEGFSHMKGW